MVKSIKYIFAKNFLQDIDVIIHIGAPKTGTSAIQNFLLSNRKILEKYGYYYPPHGKDMNNISGGHSNLGLSLMNEEYDKAHNIYNTYLNEAKEKNLTLLLSAESFYNHASKLKKITGSESIKIIAFKRDPIESLFSNYNQSVKRHFQTTTLPQFCKNILTKNKNLSLTSEVLEKWKEYFDTKNIKILEYNKNLFIKKSIEETFLESIGMQRKQISNIKPKAKNIVNKSYTTAALELKRVLNYVLDKNNTKKNNEIDWYLQAYSDNDNEDSLPYYEIPNQIILELEKKYSTKINIARKNTFSSSKRLQKILQLIVSIKEEKTELYTYIQEGIKKYIKSNDILPYDVKQLCIWFDTYIEIVDEQSLWFNQGHLNAMAEGKYKEADFLRDIATLLIKRNDIKNADAVISQALKLRPNGVGIIKIKEEVTALKKLNIEDNYV